MKINSGVFPLMRVAVLMAAGVLLGNGCAGYRLGSTLPPGIDTIHIPSFVNETEEPLLDVETTRAAIQDFQQDGTLKVSNQEQADAQLDVRLTRFVLEPLRYDNDEVRTAREYRMRITADITFQRLSDGAILTQRSVQGEATFDFEGDIASSKQSVLPVAAEDLAHEIVESVVELW